MSAELYRHYDADGRLLYVGRSNNSVLRWEKGHRCYAEWAHLSVRMEIERFPSMQEASAAEMAAIASENPIHNKAKGYIVGLDRSKPARTYDKRHIEPRNACLQAYDNVMKKVHEMYVAESGRQFGSISWLAKQLGTSRQNIDNWGKRTGIPPKFVPQIARITKMKKEEVRPDTILIEMPKAAWAQLCELAPDLTSQAIVHTGLGRKYSA